MNHINIIVELRYMYSLCLCNFPYEQLSSPESARSNADSLEISTFPELRLGVEAGVLERENGFLEKGNQW